MKIDIGDIIWLQFSEQWHVQTRNELWLGNRFT